MQGHIQKWGNSLGLRIPIKLAKKLQLHPGSTVDLEVEDGRLIIQSPKYDLDTMLKGITPENQHHFLYDGPWGHEEW